MHSTACSALYQNSSRHPQPGHFNHFSVLPRPSLLLKRLRSVHYNGVLEPGYLAGSLVGIRLVLPDLAWYSSVIAESDICFFLRFLAISKSWTCICFVPVNCTSSSRTSRRLLTSDHICVKFRFIPSNGERELHGSFILRSANFISCQNLKPVFESFGVARSGTEPENTESKICKYC